MQKGKISANRVVELVAILAMLALLMLLGPRLLLDQKLISLFAFDAIALVLSLAIPIYAVVRFGWVGVIAGSIILWLMAFAEGAILSAYDHERSRMLDALWFDSGWMVSIIYCAAIYGVKLLVETRQRSSARGER